MSEAEADLLNTWPLRDVVNKSMNQRGTQDGSQWAMSKLATVLVTGIVASKDIEWPQAGGFQMQLMGTCHPIPGKMMAMMNRK